MHGLFGDLQVLEHVARERGQRLVLGRDNRVVLAFAPAERRAGRFFRRRDRHRHGGVVQVRAQHAVDVVEGDLLQAGQIFVGRAVLDGERLAPRRRQAADRVERELRLRDFALLGDRDQIGG